MMHARGAGGEGEEDNGGGLAPKRAELHSLAAAITSVGDVGREPAISQRGDALFPPFGPHGWKLELGAVARIVMRSYLLYWWQWQWQWQAGRQAVAVPRHLIAHVIQVTL